MDDSEPDKNIMTTVLIHLEPGTPQSERQKIVADIDGILIDWIESISVAVVQIPVNENNDVGGQSILSASRTIEHVESDGWVYGTYEPDDPDLYDADRVYTADLLNVFEAWQYTTGDPGVVIAVLDTGITLEHPEFANKVLPGYDFFNRDDDPTDDHGHGTHVASISAAQNNNGIGSAGICGRCSILPVKVLNQDNAGTWSSVAAGVTYAADEGADIIVMSLGSIAGTKTIEDAVSYAIEKGVMIFAAAGNINSSKDFFPAAYPGVLGVAATERSDLRWALSNHGGYVDFSAPGHLIYGAYKDLDNLYQGHLFMSGTSMATPHAAGLAGLLWSQDPSRSREEIERLMAETAVDLGHPGKDEYFGAGRIDPAAALATGAASQKSSQISGFAWQDTNANGVQDSDESTYMPDMSIILRNLITDVTMTVRTNSRGFWLVSELPAGDYKINLAEDTRVEDTLIHTTPDATFKVVGPETVEHIGVGIVAELPSNVLGAIQARRVDSTVVLTWQRNSELIRRLVVERAVDNNEYEVVSKNVAGTVLTDTRSRNEFVDILPTGANDSKLSYRFLILPGESYIDGITVRPDGALKTAFFPFLER